MHLTRKVTLGLLLGIILGILLKSNFYTDSANIRYLCEASLNLLKPMGDIFLRIIKMIIVPLIFFSLISGITSMSDPGSLGRVGIKATFAFLGTTCFAVLFGLLVAFVLEPGVGVNVHFGTSPTLIEKHDFKLAEFFVNIIPSNAIGSLAEGNILQVVFFAIFTAISLNKMGSSANQIKNFFHLMSKMVFKMISMIIELSPYASFALTSWVIGTQGLAVLLSLSKLVFAVTIAMILQYLIFGLMILVFCRMSPMPFYRKSIPYQIIAFSTSSSKATLPTTMKVCRDEMGVSESSTSFLLTLGASINMDGFAINLALSTIFFAQVLGVHLEMHDYLVIILTSTLGSIGGAGIPGGSLIMLPMVLSSINLPIEGVAILAGVDRVLDMLRTTINITGDATVTLIIDHSEGTLDKDKYYL